MNFNGSDLAQLGAGLLSGGVLLKVFGLARARLWRGARRAAVELKATAEFEVALVGAAKALLEEYRGQLDFVRGRCDGLEADRDKMKAELEQTRAELAATRLELEQTRADLAEAKTADDGCRGELAEVRQQIESMIAAAGRGDPRRLARQAKGSRS